MQYLYIAELRRSPFYAPAILKTYVYTPLVFSYMNIE